LRREEIEAVEPVAAPAETVEPEPEAVPAIEAKPSKTGKTKTVIPECVERFFSDSVAKRSGGRLGATDFYQAYAEQCRAEGGDPVSPQKFGRCATANFRKAQGATNVYLGISIRQKTAKLKVVR
jgi:hypothetical protein